ncbi:MAG: hypothetical protein QOF33_2466, partial [Thermomicrobiales bacterium]|nr:hypothetical protein [Thermomicrobiales bacterium]
MLTANMDGPSRWETAVRAADEHNPTIGDEELDGLPGDAWALLVHDLRTPAAAALGRAQLLRRRLITGTDDP